MTCLWQALRSVHCREREAKPVRVDAIMSAVRSSAAAPGGDVRFLWRFLSAAAVAAMLLVAVNLYSGASPDSVALNEITDSAWTVLLTPSVLN